MKNIFYRFMSGQLTVKLSSDQSLDNNNSTQKSLPTSYDNTEVHLTENHSCINNVHILISWCDKSHSLVPKTPKFRMAMSHSRCVVYFTILKLNRSWYCPRDLEIYSRWAMTLRKVIRVVIFLLANRVGVQSYN